MLHRLIEKFRPWAEAMAGLDDPQGEYLLMLEDRISRLEGDVRLLRESDKTDAGATLAPTGSAEAERRRQP